MRHKHQRAVPPLEEILEPFHGVDIEVIGRFIEQEQTGGRDQRPGQQHAPFHPRGERFKRPFTVEIHAGEDLLHGPVRFPVGFGVGRRIGGHSGGDYVSDRADEILRHILLQKRHSGLRGEDHLPLIGLNRAGEDAHQGGFAGAVAAEQADPLAGLDMAIDTVKEGGTAVAEMNITECGKWHGGESSRRQPDRIQPLRSVGCGAAKVSSLPLLKRSPTPPRSSPCLAQFWWLAPFFHLFFPSAIQNRLERAASWPGWRPVAPP